ncbi:hypothetical protein BSLG_004413 [Batrachochytrium salamandrivorans]|nr:hypothetical protein BSLG_004413 [Batrachochytrium salamandrivorans]
MDDLAQQLQLLVLASPNSSQDVCPDHSAPMYYYCHDCKEGLCADCAVIESKHKSHSFEHLHVVYRRHRLMIDERAKFLYSRYTKYGKLLESFDEKALALSHARQTALTTHQALWEADVESIIRQESQKMASITEYKKRVLAQSDLLRTTLETLETQLTGAWHTDIIANSANIIRLIDEINPSPISDFDVSAEPFEFNSSTVPEYDRGVFRLWNDVCRHECLSVFAELVSGPPGASKYQYRVELLNQSMTGRSRNQSVSREFTSEFAVGECWGYNRFYSLDLLEQEGFYDASNDSIELVYCVRALTYAQRCRDLTYYITKLESDQKVRDFSNATISSHALPSAGFDSTVAGTGFTMTDTTKEGDGVTECDISDLNGPLHLFTTGQAPKFPVHVSGSCAPSAEPHTSSDEVSTPLNRISLSEVVNESVATVSSLNASLNTDAVIPTTTTMNNVNSLSASLVERFRAGVLVQIQHQ